MAEIPEHGTLGGARRHRLYKIPMCPECQAAKDKRRAVIKETARQARADRAMARYPHIFGSS
jgi:hypothetical protein